MATFEATTVEAVAALLEDVRVQLRESIAQLNAEGESVELLSQAHAIVCRQLDTMRYRHGVRPALDEWDG